MAYHIYTTRGFVLSSRPSREADKVYTVLTEELGLIHARGRGVRLIKSKLRAALEPYSLSSISLVRGQESWRITGASLEKSLSTESLGKDVHRVFGRVAALIERLVAGEESHKELFSLLDEAVSFVYATRSDRAEQLEVVIVLRLLYLLGYVSPKEVGEEFLIPPIEEALLDTVSTKRKVLIEVINQGLKSSHLV